MIEVHRKKLKLFYILSNLGILAFFALTISTLFLGNYYRAEQEHAEVLRYEILRSKREFIRNAVNRTIQDIEAERAACSQGATKKCDEKVLQEHLRKKIRAVRLKDNGYIWINAVLNYEGGDGYAYRFVHPNLPESEGMPLSTTMRDIKDNTPYLTELEGVKKDGEIFFDYWFKKMDSEVIQHKMTYAKLYKPYDWIVATGVYLDDIDALVQAGKARWDERVRQYVIWGLVVMGFTSLLVWFVFLLVGRRIDRMYSFFFAELGKREDALEEQVRDRTAALQESEAKYRTIVDTASEGIWVLGPDLLTTFVNERMAAMLDYRADEMLDRPAPDFLFEDDVDDFNLRMAERIRLNKSETIEQRYRRQDGGILWVQISVTPLFDGEQRFVGVSGMFTDISERKQTEKLAQARLRMLEASGEEFSLDELLPRLLDEIEAQTGSAIGFYHFLEKDQQTLFLQSWSTNTLNSMCTAEGKSCHYPVAEAGVWADCIREGRPIIHNDYASLSNRRGMPHGHAPVIRELVVPIRRGEQIMAIVGVGNKQRAYNENDVQIVSLLGDFSWEIVIRKLAEEALRKSEERYRLVYENSPVSIWEEDFSEVRKLFDTLREEGVTDIEGYFTQQPQAVRHCAELVRIIDVNRAALDLHGAATKEELVADLANTFTDESFESFREELVCLWNGCTEMSKDTVVKTLAGKTIHVTVYFAVCPGYEETLSMIIVSLAEFADRRLVEIEMRRLNESLERRVAERTAQQEKVSQQLLDSRQALMNLVEDLNDKSLELEAANSKLRELDRLKSLFIASMSHELRTPLNSIMGFTGVILNGMSGTINARQEDQLKRVYRSSKHLLSMINDIIDISKIESGNTNVVVHDFYLHTLIADAIADVQEELKKKGLLLEVDVPENLQMHTDDKRLFQCILNLLSNGIKFTERGTVIIKAEIKNSKVIISVSDTGIGIASEDIARLFHPFERIQSKLSVKAGGTGLGLYLTRKLVKEVLHGEIEVKSEKDKGSVFTLSIPNSL
jgi:PAS domain S-box-containing protein